MPTGRDPRPPPSGFLARGDRRGVVALDVHGEVFALTRWAGVKTKDVRDRLGEPDRLPGVDEVRQATRKRMASRLREHLREDRQNQAEAMKPLLTERAGMVAAHRVERAILEARQDARRRAETRARGERLNKGLRGVWELLTGKAAAIRRQNEAEAYRGHLRDRDQREMLFKAQMKERDKLQRAIEYLRGYQRLERIRLVKRIAVVLKNGEERERERNHIPPPTARTRNFRHNFS